MKEFTHLTPLNSKNLIELINNDLSNNDKKLNCIIFLLLIRMNVFKIIVPNDSLHSTCYVLIVRYI